MADEIAGLEFEKPILELEAKIQELKSCSASEHLDFTEELKVLEEKCSQLKTQIYGNLTPWQRVMIARHAQRPYTLDYIRALCTQFIELHGDRSFSDDAALVGGLAMFENQPVVVLGHQKGRTVQESMLRNFGMPHPEGYRKALRMMKLAEKFNRPVICFIDTPGAYPGIGAEERGQARAIALNLFEMAALKVPVTCMIIGEGGSGGALAIGMGDRVLMCENAWYSVISPEGCAAILFRDAARASEAAAALKLTAPELKALGIIDEIIPEPLGGGHRDPGTLMEAARAVLSKHLKELKTLSTEDLLENRYQKFRALGVWREAEVEKVEKTGRRRTTKLKSA
ncbi:MAG: acetyl-CoA carboxylase carboxyltransferase subunit alpha [Elusimicrobia bacterium RIFCSPLOWO2_01_FULL_59_12]|nr:MAG: acetyl-CoA carboxylase carboxyltransferase subunit alpha [Elusimicrobia bacterium RIFCSPLOWO2_01_FULL_59_12]